MGLIILCPYFKRERKKSITCEDTIRSYQSKADKNRQLKAHCSSEWESCPYASRMESIWALDLPEDVIKEKIMENTLESMKKEINNLMRENGQLMKKVDKLKDDIKKKDDIAKTNHEMYRSSLENKDKLIKAKDQHIEWLESFASAFLVVAYGEDATEIRLKQEDVLKLMTQYKLTCRLDKETGEWIINVAHGENTQDAN